MTGLSNIPESPQNLNYYPFRAAKKHTHSLALLQGLLLQPIVPLIFPSQAKPVPTVQNTLILWPILF